VPEWQQSIKQVRRAPKKKERVSLSASLFFHSMLSSFTLWNSLCEHKVQIVIDDITRLLEVGRTDGVIIAALLIATLIRRSITVTTKKGKEENKKKKKSLEVTVFYHFASCPYL
jgi:hypothetical protein